MVDIVQVGLSVDSKQVDKGTKSLGRLEKQGYKTETATSKMSRGFKALGGIIAAIGFAALLNSMVKTAAEFESMAISLEVVTGSAEKATQAMEGITAFAKKTPFQVSEITDAFIKLKALGITPTEASLTSFGNTSSAMGKSLNQMIEAVADASTFEFERLKEFGIKAKQNADSVIFTFQGVSTEIGKTSAEITDYLESIGREKFGGAMEKQMDTLNGKLSNLGDSFDMFAVKLLQDNTGGKGVLDLAIDAVDFLTDGLTTVRIGVVETIGGFNKFFVHVKSGAEWLQAELATLWTKRDENVARFASIAAAKKAEIDAINATVDAYIAGEERKKEAGLGAGGIDIAGKDVAAEEAAKQVAADKAFELETDRIFAQIELDDQKLANKLEFNEKMLAAEMDYYDRLYNMETGSQQAALDFTSAIRSNNLKGALQNGSLMLSNASKQNKAAFEVQKAFALANAIVTLPSAVMKSYDNGGGYPWGLVPAGLMLATGLAQISAISSTSFGSKSSGASVSGGGSTSPSAPVASGLPAGSTALPSAAETPTQQVSITLNGAGYSRDDVRELIGSINEELGDGSTLVAA